MDPLDLAYLSKAVMMTYAVTGLRTSVFTEFMLRNIFSVTNILSNKFILSVF